MSLWRHFARGFRVLAARSRADRDLTDEVEHYIDQATAELVARGVPPAEAARTARLEMGNPTVVRELVRGSGWESAVDAFFADIRFGLRRLRHDRTFTAVSVLTLAVGMGATTAIFSVVSPVLFDPLPYPHADRVVTITDRGVAGAPLDPAFGTFREIADRSRSFVAVAAMKPWQPTLTGPAEPERLEGQRVTAAYFAVLGVRPALGRDFQPADDAANGPRVAILSYQLWQRRFAGDPAIVGREVTLDDDEYLITGIMPRGFENVLAPAADAWTTLQYDMALPQAWGHHLKIVGRLRPGVRLQAARAELTSIARHPVPPYSRPPWAALRQGVGASLLADDVTRDVKPVLFAVLGAVALLLLAACVNLANLLLARGVRRRGEFAMQVAIGAGRARLIRQVLTESLLLAIAGGGAAFLVAQAGMRTMIAQGPSALPRLHAIGLNAGAFALMALLSAAVGLAFGVVPALSATRGDPCAGLLHSSQRVAGGHRVVRRLLVVSEVALALILLLGSGLLLRSVRQLLAVAPGFDAAHLLTMQIQTSGHRFDDGAATQRFFAQALDAVRRVPGVASAGLTSQLPLSGEGEAYGVQFESPTAERDAGSDAVRYAVSPGYVETMRIALRRGRLFDPRDREGAPGVVLVSEALARRRFPGGDAVGRRLRIGPSDGPQRTIVGVVADVKQASLALGEPDAVYMPAQQSWFADRALWLVVRADGDATTLAREVRRAVWSVDKDQPIMRVATMSERVMAAAAERRFALFLFELFGAVALLMAGIGIYAVLSGSVAERTREIGVRMALGASGRQTLALILREGLTLTGAGMVLGIAGALMASRALVTLLYGVSRLDAVAHLAVIAIVAGVATVACAFPAWRASRIDPAITLRAE